MFMLIQARHLVSCAPSDEGRQHSWAPGRSFQLRLRLAFSGLFSPCGHSIRRWWCCVPVLHESTFLCPFAPLPLRSFHATMDTLTPVRLARRGHWPMSRVCEAPTQVSLLHAQSLHDHSVSNHPTWRSHRFNTLPLSVTAFRFRRSRLRHWLAGSPHTSGRIEFVILRTDRSPPAAPHPASRRRSCSRLQAGERLPEEDFHLSDSPRFQAH